MANPREKGGRGAEAEPTTNTAIEDLREAFLAYEDVIEEEKNLQNHRQERLTEFDQSTGIKQLEKDVTARRNEHNSGSTYYPGRGPSLPYGKYTIRTEDDLTGHLYGITNKGPRDTHGKIIDPDKIRKEMAGLKKELAGLKIWQFVRKGEIGDKREILNKLLTQWAPIEEEAAALKKAYGEAKEAYDKEEDAKREAAAQAKEKWKNDTQLKALEMQLAKLKEEREQLSNADAALARELGEKHDKFLEKITDRYESVSGEQLEFERDDPDWETKVFGEVREYLENLPKEERGK